MNSQRRLVNVLGPLQGARIPGGCDSCDACQTVDPVKAGVWKLTVHHDADCKWLAGRKRGGAP